MVRKTRNLKMIEKTKNNWKVFKTRSNTEELRYKIENDEDDYGSSIRREVKDWHGFVSDLYYIEDTAYGKTTHYPVAPSGKYSERYGKIFKKTLRNLDFVGNYDGENFDFEVPYLYTSIFELEPEEQFALESDCSGSSGLEKAREKSLIVEKFVVDEINDLSCNVTATEIKTGQKHLMYGDIKVKRKPLLTSKQENDIIMEAVALLVADGWQKISQDISDCYVLVMDRYGAINHRYLTWGEDYSEWHGRSFLYPEYWTSERQSIYDDVDDYTQGIAVCTTLPKITENTRMALELLESID